MAHGIYADRFVGVRMEGGVKTVRTFGYARNLLDEIGQIYSAVQNQRTVWWVWTGKTYKTPADAAADSWRLNSAARMEV